MDTSQNAISSEPVTLCNGVREALLQQGHAKGLLVLEALYALKITPHSEWTFEEIYRLCRDNFGQSRRLVYEGLRESPLIFYRYSTPAGERRHQRGRPPLLYRVPQPIELEAEFAPNQPPSPTDTFEPADLKSVYSYRLALYREWMIRQFLESDGKGVTTYRAFQAERLGVSPRTMRTYDKKLGFSHTANYRKVMLSSTDLQSLPRYKKRFDKTTGKRLASRQWLETHDWQTGHTTRFPFVKYLAYKALKGGQDVYRVERLANTYYPYQRPDEASFEGAGYDTDFYLANRNAYERAGFSRSDGEWHYTPPGSVMPSEQTAFYLLE